METTVSDNCEKDICTPGSGQSRRGFESYQSPLSINSVVLTNKNNKLSSDSVCRVPANDTEQRNPISLDRQKSCSSCGQSKFATDFYKNKAKPDGLESRCKKCVLEAKKRKRDKLVIRQRATVLALSDLDVRLAGSPDAHAKSDFCTIVGEAIGEFWIDETKQ